MKYHTGAMCGGVLSGSAGRKLLYSRKYPPISGPKNTMAAKMIRKPATPMMSCTV
ncbi:Uncharacterised protein [Bordetella pertussis]|nr:Uncharacterised protein [Bordetella pertussis]CFO11645.1 Uncharacterised protein [Bordetella pertussis]CFO79287.1 Uncharacterised protein [Bordetella pertussis]CFU79333.1 Uncharacterised protein [Bordetella pertussis]CPI59950.1 Uncharacterised protein [Bordetella pertussis]